MSKILLCRSATASSLDTIIFFISCNPFGKYSKTRMHSSRMRTARSSSRRGVPPGTPWDQTPRDQAPPQDQATLQDLAPPGPGTPLWTATLRLRAVILCCPRSFSENRGSYPDDTLCTYISDRECVPNFLYGKVNEKAFSHRYTAPVLSVTGIQNKITSW